MVLIDTADEIRQSAFYIFDAAYSLHLQKIPILYSMYIQRLNNVGTGQPSAAISA